MSKDVRVITTLGGRRHSDATAVVNCDGSLSVSSGDYRMTYAAGVWRSFDEKETP